jgi:hypothetical protein
VVRKPGLTNPSAPTLSPLATAELWDLVSEGYVAESSPEALWASMTRSPAPFALRRRNRSPSDRVLRARGRCFARRLSSLLAEVPWTRF